MGSRRATQSSFFSQSLQSIWTCQEEPEETTRPKTADNSSICPRTADSFLGANTRRIRSTQSHENVSSRRNRTSPRYTSLGEARLEAKRIGSLAIAQEKLRQDSLRDNSFIREVRVFRKINESNGLRTPGVEDIANTLKREMHSKYMTGSGVLRATINELDSELQHHTEEIFDESLLHTHHADVNRAFSPQTSRVSIGRTLQLSPNRRRDTFRIEQADTYHALLEADLPGAMRYDQLKAQNLSVSMTIKEIKAIFSGGSHSEVVLVVCLDEDTRILPLKTTVDRARDLTKIESSQRIALDFSFDGNLAEYPLYVGVHRIAGNPLGIGWETINPGRSANLEAFGGNISCLSGFSIDFDNISRNRLISACLPLSPEVPLVRLEDFQVEDFESCERAKGYHDLMDVDGDGRRFQRTTSNMSFARTMSNMSSNNLFRTTSTMSVARTPSTEYPDRVVEEQKDQTSAYMAETFNLSDRLIRTKSGASFRNTIEAVVRKDIVVSPEPQVVVKKVKPLLSRKQIFVQKEENTNHPTSPRRVRLSLPYISIFSSFSPEQEDACRMLQKLFRGHLGRKKFAGYKRMREQQKIASYNISHINSAVVIQRFFRSCRLKKKLGGKLVTDAQQTDSLPLGSKGKGFLNLQVSIDDLSSGDIRGLFGHHHYKKMLCSQLSFMGDEPILRIPNVGFPICITRDGLLATTCEENRFSIEAERLRIAFPFASSLLQLGKKKLSLEKISAGVSARGKEIEMLASAYPKLKGRKKIDRSTGLMVIELQKNHLSPASTGKNGRHITNQVASAMESRKYCIKCYDLLSWNHRYMLRNEIAAQIIISPHIPESLFEPIRNSFLLYGSIAPEAIAVIEKSLTSIPLELLSSSLGPIPEPVLSGILWDILQVLNKVHDVCGCVHNYIDVRSFLLNTIHGDLKVTNFAFCFFPGRLPGADIRCRSTERWKSDKRKFMGPLRVKSPERLLGLEVSFPSDIWSFGILAAWLAKGKFPLPVNPCSTKLAFKTFIIEENVRPLPVDPADPDIPNSNMRVGNPADFTPSVRRILQENGRDDWRSTWKPKELQETSSPKYFSPELSDLISCCLEKRSYKRPSAAHLLKHRFFLRFRPDAKELKHFLHLNSSRLSSS